MKANGPTAVPDGEITWMFLTPALAPTGDTPVIVVEFTTTKEVSATPLIAALVAVSKWVPVIVTGVPPIAVPVFGRIPVTVIH